MSVRRLMDPVYRDLRGVGFDGYEDFMKRTDLDFFTFADPFYPDACIPEHIKQGIYSSLESNAAHYTLPVGLDELRRAVAERVRRVNGIQVDHNKNIIITSGSDLSYNFAMRPFLTPGEENEVMAPVPSYTHNFVSPGLMGGKTVPVPTYAEDGYDLRIEEFERRVSAKTRIVSITNPNNPTGTVYKRETLERLAEFCIRHDLILFADQCFEEHTFDGYEMFNIINIPGMWERTILCNSFSKSMGLCGFRLAYLVAHEEIMSVLQACAVQYVGAPSTMIQCAGIAALRNNAFVEDMRREFQVRAEAAYRLLSDIPGVKCTMPQAGFYIWLDVGELGTSKEVCDYLLEQARVVVTSSDGDMWGPGTGRYGVRIIYGSRRDRDECFGVLERIRQALLNYPKAGS
ncbi:pyridoxal phosphate-dependent aminotransferase [Lawsonibacter faecis]|uniref:Aminotransferase n=1 Tax=Lawsonibacter faecis TaxID=2763052 RepID=A0A8J6JNL8_9FIRM|nr:pyridoxal phosphate-dependent aminotransferase [Lawsonibacter faecis]MBC5738299.1 pyridoxal phosphate-dependent aminotransferase [Lawsonibacter faecis]